MKRMSSVRKFESNSGSLVSNNLLKCFFVLIIMVCVTNTVEAQKDTRKYKPVNALKIGDKIPDLALDQIAEVVYNKTGKKRFSDFKGKLIILDFWNIRCGSCIAGFPKMEKLQKQFKDSIQVFFVNAEQSQSEIFADLGKMHQVNPFPFDVPQLVNAKILGELFPYYYSGSQVWIDPKGIVRMVEGGAMNNHAQKIREVIAGKPINYVALGSRENSGAITTLSSLINAKSNYTPLQQSLILPYNEQIGLTSVLKKNIKDEIRKTRRSIFANWHLFDLYGFALLNKLSDSWEHEIVPVYSSNLNKFYFDVRDTLRYTDYFSQRRDIDWLQSVYGYEQTLPESVSENERNNLMVNDLNQYFGSVYGTLVRIEPREQNCFLLVKTSSFQFEKVKSKTSVASQMSFMENQKKMIAWKGMPLKWVISNYAHPNLFSLQKIPFLDETEYAEKVDILLPDPADIHSLEELRVALKAYGLDIIVAPRKLDMIVVTDNSTQQQGGR